MNYFFVAEFIDELVAAEDAGEETFGAGGKVGISSTSFASFLPPNSITFHCAPRFASPCTVPRGALPISGLALMVYLLPAAVTSASVTLPPTARFSTILLGVLAFGPGLISLTPLSGASSMRSKGTAVDATDAAEGGADETGLVCAIALNGKITALKQNKTSVDGLENFFMIVTSGLWNRAAIVAKGCNYSQLYPDYLARI